MCVWARGAKACKGETRSVFIAETFHQRLPRTQRVRVRHVSVLVPSNHVIDVLLNLDPSPWISSACASEVELQPSPSPKHFLALSLDQPEACRLGVRFVNVVRRARKMLTAYVVRV